MPQCYFLKTVALSAKVAVGHQRTHSRRDLLHGKMEHQSRVSLSTTFYNKPAFHTTSLCPLSGEVQ